jgi:hypothetical protein
MWRALLTSILYPICGRTEILGDVGVGYLSQGWGCENLLVNNEQFKVIIVQPRPAMLTKVEREKGDIRLT